MIKAKLKAAESNITTFEQEFLAYLVLPNGQSVFEQVVQAIETGSNPQLLIEG
ncbi:hypothetical protein [Leucobacter sp. wl10]|uniref:hypothetical protein n=1 Tax=Leucobacter sp. wl10 TaxID=2304677 RepID=UPI0019699050|nr:hypothetical protein [Leucobacter sp. wl10]